MELWVIRVDRSVGFSVGSELSPLLEKLDFYNFTLTSNEQSLVIGSKRKSDLESVETAISSALSNLKTGSQGIAKDELFKVERGWNGLVVNGQLDFGLVGILAHISGILAAQKISIFAISTYDTDYILLKEDNMEKAIEKLIEAKISVE
ncbi:hypothetical protein BB559_004830 [Furculomyces boomerangus]|uniref:CASTOR ACT domain-containing protein n=2 Tax=Harpellales TaxID=61421 RepID=A0A2T9Y703_9FUNG|nr:hypothetical protein BB559_005713 [Furculomyces boomerangus]PVU90007.1 hypothetical protein BB559_004830 [Furculomyces boomerangus]PWA00350.1 hypothetical protein BB558_003599 [Smittium angustum]